MVTRLISLLLLLVASTVSAAPYGLRSVVNPPAGFFAGAGLANPSVKSTEGAVFDVTASPYFADKTGATDCSSAVASAMYDASYALDNRTLLFPAGTYKFVGSGPTSVAISTWTRGQYRMRGENDSGGNPISIIKIVYTGTAQVIGFNVGRAIAQNEYTTPTVITAGLTKTSNVITVTSSSGIVAGDVGLIDYQPDFSRSWYVSWTPGFPFLYRSVYVVSKSGNDLTLDSPIGTTYASSQTTNATFKQSTKNIFKDFGVENFVIDMSESVPTGGGSNYASMWFQGGYNCWITNVRVRTSSANYGMAIENAVNCLVEENWVERTGLSGSSHAGIIIRSNTRVLYRHNIVRKNYPNWEVNHNTIGSVFSFNDSDDGGAFTGMDINHGPQNELNVYESNYVPNILSDSYTGGSWGDIIYRNRLHGLVTDEWASTHPGEEDKPFWTGAVTLRRLVRNGTIVGNIACQNGYSSDVYGFGSPGGGGSLITAQLSLGDPWADSESNGTPKNWTGTLTTSTTSTSGVVTLDTGQGTSFAANLSGASNIRALSGHSFVTIVSVVGDVVTYNNGSGTNLTPGDLVRFAPSPYGFYETDLDVEATAELLGNYDYVSHSIPAGQALGSTTLPDSLYLSAITDDPRMAAEGFTSAPFDPTNPGAATDETLPSSFRRKYGYWRTSSGSTATPSYSVRKVRVLRR